MNYFIAKVMDSLFSEPTPPEHGFRLVYREHFAAFYQAIVSRLIYSSAAYIVMYMSLIISLDRFAAIWLAG